MNILCIGDLHIRVENIAAVDLLETQLAAILDARRGALDAVVVLGDVLHHHERLHTTPLNRAHKLFKALASFGVPVFVLVGNHDYIQNDQFLTERHWMNVLECVRVVDKVVQFRGLTLCPYVPVGRFHEALETAAHDWRASELICCHQEFEGAVMRNGHVSVAGDPWAAEFPRVVSGHIHERQTLESGVHYVGAALPGLGDRAAVTLWAAGRVETIPLAFPRRARVVCSLDDAAAHLDRLPDIKQMILSGDPAAFTSFRAGPTYAALRAAGVQVVFRHEMPARPRGPPARFKSFPEQLLHRVLATRDENVYCAYQLVVHDRELDPADVMIVGT